MKGFGIRGLAGGVVAMFAAAVLAPGAVDAWPTLGVCQYDAVTNVTSCSYSNPDGIKSVFISLDTDDGIVVVVNETYDCESPVFVQWENLGPAHHYEVVACPPDPAVPEPDPLPVGTLPDRPEAPRIVDGLEQPQADAHEPLLLTPRFMK